MNKKIRKIIPILVITLFFTSALVSANNIKNDVGICSDCEREETYDIYAQNAISLNGDFNSNFEDHKVELSPGVSSCEGEWEVNIYCSSEGIVEDSLKVGIKFYDDFILGTGPVVKVKNHNTNSWNWLTDEDGIDRDTMGWWWSDSISNSNDYVSSRERVIIRLESDGNDYTILDSLGVKFTDRQDVDQCITTYSSSSKLPVTQTFTPSFEKLTRVKALLKPTTQSPNGDVFFKILDSDGEIITPKNVARPVNFGRQNAVEPYKWIDFEFEDIQLIPGRTYSIEIELSSGSFEWCKDSSGQLCYKTYGLESTSEYNPSMFVSDEEITFTVKKTENDQTPDIPYQSFYLRNDGTEGSCYEWRAEVTGDFISIDKNSGICYSHVNGPYSGWKYIEVNVDYSGKEGDEDGETYNGIITISAPGIDEEKTIDVKMVVYNLHVKNVHKYTLFFNIMERFPVLSNVLELVF